MIRHRITFVTPLFSKGSYDHLPELRAPSIRGQLHWWFRALGGSAAEENATFGSVHSKPVLASPVVVRVANVSGQTAEMNTLPHKQGGEASPKAAFLAGTSFELLISERLGGLTENRRSVFRRTLEAWLLAGTLGLRATRAAGSFVWEPLDECSIPMPATTEAFVSRLHSLFDSSPLTVRLLDLPFSSAEEARAVASDTLGGRRDPGGTSDLSRLRDPLGKVFGGRKRKTSPLRFRIVRLEDAFRVVAIWDGRSIVTGNRAEDLYGIAKLLASRGKPIGDLLVKAIS